MDSYLHPTRGTRLHSKGLQLSLEDLYPPQREGRIKAPLATTTCSTPFLKPLLFEHVKEKLIQPSAWKAFSPKFSSMSRVSRPSVVDRNIRNFVWYGGVAGDGLRSVGEEALPSSKSVCSILPIAHHSRARTVASETTSWGRCKKPVEGEPKPLTPRPSRTPATSFPSSCAAVWWENGRNPLSPATDSARQGCRFPF